MISDHSGLDLLVVFKQQGDVPQGMIFTQSCCTQDGYRRIGFIDTVMYSLCQVIGFLLIDSDDAIRKLFPRIPGNRIHISNDEVRLPSALQQVVSRLITTDDHFGMVQDPGAVVRNRELAICKYNNLMCLLRIRSHVIKIRLKYFFDH